MDENLKRLPLEFSQLKTNKFIVLPTAATTYTMTKSQIQNALNTKNIELLRQYSQYFYSVSGEYRRLVEYYGKLFTQDFIVFPRAKKEDLMDYESFSKKIEKVKNYVMNSSISETCLEIATLVVRDGAFFGYEREIDGMYIMQQLPTQYCRTRYKMKGVYISEFDFRYFDQFRNAKDLDEQLSAFPKEFKSLYNAYKSDQSKRWALLDPQYSRTHILWDGIPLLAPIMLDLIDLTEYKAIEKTKSKLDIYKLLIQRVPVNKEGEVSMLLPEIMDLHDNFRQMVTSDHVDVLTTPAEIDVVDLADKNQGVSNDIEKAKDAIYTAAGTSSALFHSGSKTGSVGLEASEKTDESLMYPILKQFEKWYELKINSISKDPKWAVLFVPVTSLNRIKMVDMYKNASTLGYPTRSLTNAALGLRPFDEDALLDYENLYLDLPNRMKPAVSSYNGGIDGENQGGAPESDDPLTEEGQRTRDEDKNANRA